MASDVPKVAAGAAMNNVGSAASSGSLLKNVAKDAQAAGMKLPKMQNLGMTMEVKVQPPRAPKEYDTFSDPPSPAPSFGPPPNVTVSADPNAQSKSVPAGFFPNV